MAVIRELEAGQSHTFAKTGLRVTLTGAAGTGISLRAFAQAGDVIDSSQASQLSQTQLILWPVERRVRLIALPSGAAFAAGVQLGLNVVTEGGASTEQVVVSQVDVGSLASRELAVIEFASDRSVLTVAGQQASAPPPLATTPVNGARVPGEPITVVTPPQSNGATRPPWAEAGLYALRNAERLGLIGPGRGTSWGLVLDGSASLLPIARSGQLSTLVELIAGICLERSGAWPTVTAVAGTTFRDVPEARQQPAALVAAAFDSGEPASWSFLADAAARVASQPSAPGLVVLCTDGVPGDIAALPDVASRHPNTHFLVASIASSRRGLGTDAADVEWWADELAGIEVVDATPTISVIAVAADRGELRLSEPRPAEFARAVALAGAAS